MFAVLGAAPSVLWACSQPSLISDDWWVAATVHFRGVWGAISVIGLHQTGRPIAGLYLGSVFGVFGSHPVPHALVLGLLNGLAAVLVWFVARRLFPRQLALLVTVAWTVLANRSSGHYWFSVGVTMLALCCLLIGVLLLLQERPWWAVVAFASGVLTYEGVVVLAGFAVAAWVVQDSRRRWRRGAAMQSVLFAAAAFVWFHSPKLDSAPHFFANGSRWGATLAGSGIFTTRAGAAVGGAIVLGVVAVALARAVAPGFATTRSQRTVLFGVAVALGGLLPFLLAGFPTATDGLFDRGNIVAGLGTAIVLGVILNTLANHLPPSAKSPVLVALVVTLALPGLHGLSTYVEAASAGDQLKSQLASAFPLLAQPLVVGPRLGHPGGVAEFVATWDTSAYLQLRQDDSAVRARMACTAHDFRNADEAITFNRITGSVSRRASSSFGSAECHHLGLGDTERVSGPRTSPVASP